MTSSINSHAKIPYVKLANTSIQTSATYMLILCDRFHIMRDCLSAFEHVRNPKPRVKPHAMAASLMSSGLLACGSNSSGMNGPLMFAEDNRLYEQITVVFKMI